MSTITLQFDGNGGMVGTRWEVFKLDSLATISRELQSLHALKFNKHISPSLVTASMDPSAQDRVSARERILVCVCMCV
jgi:hypothetical protein